MSDCGRSAAPPRFAVVVIVASLGGLRPLSVLLAGLPADFPAPLLVLQHRYPSEQQDALAVLLSGRTVLPVRSACDGMPLRGPGVMVIPPQAAAAVDGDRYLRLQPWPRRRVSECSDGDALLASAAAASAPDAVIGVVLSGRMRDGSDGIRAVKRRGGRVLAQDPATAQAPDMPVSAIVTGCVDFILPPGRIAAALISLVMAPGGAQLLTVPIPHWAALGA